MDGSEGRDVNPDSTSEGLCELTSQIVEGPGTDTTGTVEGPGWATLFRKV